MVIMIVVTGVMKRIVHRNHRHALIVNLNVMMVPVYHPDGNVIKNKTAMGERMKMIVEVKWDGRQVVRKMSLPVIMVDVF